MAFYTMNEPEDHSKKVHMAKLAKRIMQLRLEEGAFEL